MGLTKKCRLVKFRSKKKDKLSQNKESLPLTVAYCEMDKKTGFW